MVKMEEIRVIKKDGSIEYWNSDKILVSLTKAGLELEKAEKLVSEIEEWVKNNSKNKQIESTILKEEIILRLEEVDTLVAEGYSAYKK